MLLSTTFAARVALAVSLVNAVTVDLNPVEGKTGAYMSGASRADRTRVASLKSKAYSGDTTVPVTDLDYVQYTASIGVGNPPTYYNLVVDTGSSNTFVGTGKAYVRTKTSVATGEAVGVEYGQGYWTGYEYLDEVTIAPGFIIQNQSIGDALQSQYFEGVDGIIGVGPVDLTLDTLDDEGNATIPTVLNNAQVQGLIQQQVLGVSFAPASSNVSTNGKLSFGGVDDSLFVEKIVYTPVTTTFPASQYWGVNVSGAMYGIKTVIPGSNAGIVDTGTTLIYIANNWYETYLAAIPGSYYDANVTGMTVVPESGVPFMLSFTFYVDGQAFVLDPAAQVLPEDQNAAWGGEPGVRYGYIGPIGWDSGVHFDFVIGQKFMERFYAVFDTSNNRVGFAYTDHTFSVI